MEVVERAEDLYCLDGCTFDQVGTLTGVSVPTLKRWSEKYAWQKKREEVRQARSAIRINRVLAHEKSLSTYLKSGQAQDAYAVAAIESAVQKAAEAALKRQAEGASETGNLREIRSELDAVAALEEAVQIKLNSLLANPGGISFAVVKDVKQALALIGEMKAKAAPDQEESKRKKGLTPETAEMMRKKLLEGCA
ncbi:MAG: hypothetical protein ABFD98_15680 [Syntrophobacteraceae bacterium]|nr:hypothetical protein [Desulfobacteraceae bacterium]